MDRWQKINSWIRSNKSDLFIAALIFLVSIASFGLGRLSVLWPAKEPLTIEEPDMRSGGMTAIPNEGAPAPEQSATISGTTPIKGKYVASQSGTAYHLPWCPGALRIKEENKIWFQTKEEAEGRGYKPAGNCPGL